MERTRCCQQQLLLPAVLHSGRLLTAVPICCPCPCLPPRVPSTSKQVLSYVHECAACLNNAPLACAVCAAAHAVAARTCIASFRSHRSRRCCSRQLTRLAKSSLSSSWWHARLFASVSWARRRSFAALVLETALRISAQLVVSALIALSS